MNGRPRRVCLFAQYHPRGRLPPVTIGYVHALRELGFEVCVAASGVDAPPAEDRAALEATGASLFARPNLGLDFGAWQHLIEAGCTAGADTILLANDSVFGPFRPLGPVFDHMEAQHYDVWGMVESVQRAWHLQSWFLHLTADAFHRPAVQQVFGLPFHDMDKEMVIAEGELGLGRALRAEGLRCAALVRRADATWVARRLRLNMMHLDWRHNLRRLGMPFLKAELLRVNTMRLPWATQWEEVLRELGADPGPIHAHLLDYTGVPGERWTVPVKPISWRLYLGFLLATHDRGAALRAFDVRNLRLSLGKRGLAAESDTS